MNRLLYSRQQSTPLTRRDMLRTGTLGFGAIALAELLREDGSLKAEDGALSAKTQFPPKARNVVFIFLGGVPSQVDTFDPKPLLHKLHGKDVPASIGVPRCRLSSADTFCKSR